MTYDERTSRNAVLVSANGEVQRLKRIPYMSGSFNEAWLQTLLEGNPGILPSGEIGGEYAPLVCIGREVPVGSGETQGYIDNLYVSPSGYVVIVETKLFRNQESRRTVVAQIIDYAKELQKWDCEKLNSIAADYFLRKEGQAKNIIDVMVRHGYCTFSDEARLVDAINNSMSKAAFLLMIVGDGIRTGVQQLAEFLNENTSMSFHLALTELEIYPVDDHVIVIPNLLTKTTVIERRFHPPHAEETIAPAESKPIQRPILSRREFIAVFAKNGGFDPDEIAEFVSDVEAIDGITIGIAPTELTFRFSLEDGSSYAFLTFSISSDHADVWIMPGRIQAALEKHGRLTFCADAFLEFFKQFVNRKRCKYPPYENGAGFYYSNLSDILQRKKDFITAVEAFATGVAHPDQ